MPPKLTPPPASVDLDKLMKMQEPLTVVVVRLRGNNREPIPLPTQDGYTAGGAGWSIGDVRDIDQMVIPISGGGVYEVQVVDSTQPEVQTLKWSFVLPPEVYPVKPPSTALPTGTLSAAYAPYATQPQPPNYGASTPIGNVPQQPPNGMAAWLQAQQQNIPPWWMMQPGGRGVADQNTQSTQLREELFKRDLELERERHRHEREMAELKRLAETPKRADSDELARERDRADRAERDVAEARRIAEAAAAEARHKADLAALEARLAAMATPKTDEAAELRREMALNAERQRTDERFNQLQASIAALAAAPKGPDPMLMFLVEMTKNTADAAREQARLKADADKELARAQVEAARIAADGQNRLVTELRTVMAPNMVSPVEMARLVKDASTSADQVTRQMMGSMGDMMNLSREFTANLLQMAPQGGGIGERVVGALENAVTTWSQNQAQVETARANAARSQNPQAQQWQQPAPATGPVVTPPPQHIPSQITPGDSQPLAGPPVTEPPPGVAGPAPLRHGKTDEQWFGQPGVSDINRLRVGVAEYLAATAQAEAFIEQPAANEPPTICHPGTKKPVGVTPIMCARFVLMAAHEIRTKQIPVEAFTYFFEQGMYPALMDVVLPDAPPGYRNDVLRFLHRLLNAEPIFRDNDEPMFGLARFFEEDDEDDAEGAEGAEAPPSNGTNGAAAPVLVKPPVAPPRGGNQRPRPR